MQTCTHPHLRSSGFGSIHAVGSGVTCVSTASNAGMSDVRMRMKKDPVAWPILGEYNRGFVHYPDSFAIPASPLWIISGLIVTVLARIRKRGFLITRRFDGGVIA